ARFPPLAGAARRPGPAHRLGRLVRLRPPAWLLPASAPCLHRRAALPSPPLPAGALRPFASPPSRGVWRPSRPNDKLSCEGRWGVVGTREPGCGPRHEKHSCSALRGIHREGERLSVRTTFTLP